MTSTRNPFAFREPITLDNLHELFAHHRGLTGGWSMEGEGGGGDGGSGGSGGSGDGGTGGQGGDYTPPATQADLDRIVGQRLAREREKYADYEELKTKAEAHDAAVEAARTESEKAIEAARKEGEQTATERSNTVLVRSKAEVLLAGEKARNAEEAAKLLDLTGIKVSEQGVIDSDAIKTKVAELKTSSPYLFDTDEAGGKPGRRTPKPDASQGGGGGGSRTRGGSVAEVMAERAAARAAKNNTTTS